MRVTSVCKACGAPESVLEQHIGPLNLVDLWLRASRHLGWLFFLVSFQAEDGCSQGYARNSAPRPVSSFTEEPRRPFSIRQRSSAIDPRRSSTGPGEGQCWRRDRERRAALSGIPDPERHSGVFCFFLRLFLYLDGRLCTPLRARSTERGCLAWLAQKIELK